MRAVLESDSDSDIDAGSDVSNDKNNDEDDRALQDAAFDVQVDDKFDATTSDGDDIGDVQGGSTTSDDSVSDEQEWTCPTFLWRPAASISTGIYSNLEESSVKMSCLQQYGSTPRCEDVLRSVSE